MNTETALLSIDIQNDYFPGGRMELFAPLEAALKASALLDFFRRNKFPVVHIAHESVRPGATFFLPATVGQEIHTLVKPENGECVITKNFPNSFLGTPLLEHLRRLDVSRLVVAGMMTHMCVDATTRAAVDLGFDCRLIHDATATRGLSFADVTVPAAQVKAAFLAALTVLCARVQTADEFFAENGGPRAAL
ncbi:MAG: cysteine hydrolase family protein [Syntrophobacteraceae bacterium]|nr:cysteine hydrolase family protein [Syntrophobacteraceae bacterium]